MLLSIVCASIEATLRRHVCSRDLEELHRQTEDAVQRLSKTADERRMKLEQCLQLHKLETETSEVR